MRKKEFIENSARFLKEAEDAVNNNNPAAQLKIDIARVYAELAKVS